MFNRPLDSWTPRKGDNDLLLLAITVHRATPPTAVGLLVKNNAVWHIAGKDHRIEVLPRAGWIDLMEVVSNNYNAALGSPRMRGFCLSRYKAK